MAQLRSNPAVSEKIPTVIHQIWIQGRAALPEMYKIASSTWQKKNPGWNYTLWDDQALREFMASEAAEWLPLYDSQGEMEAKADVARYALLQVKGGLYADMDTECVRPVARMLERSSASLFLQVYDYPWTPSRYRPVQYPWIKNSVMASAPAHPIWMQVRAAIECNLPSWFVPLRTGPLMLWPIAKSFAEHHAQDVCFWDHRQILTASYIPRACMRAYGSIRRKVCVLDFNDSVRKALARELRRPHHLPRHLAAFVAAIAKEKLPGRQRSERL